MVEEKAKVYSEGRRCKYKDCNKPLSIYNPGPYCFKHAFVAKFGDSHKNHHPLDVDNQTVPGNSIGKVSSD